MRVPYISAQEFSDAPTGLNLSTLIPSGTSVQQSAELARILWQASGWIDNYCHQVLRATVDTKQERTWVTKDGALYIRPGFWPIRSVSALQYRFGTTQPWNVLDATQADIYERYFRYDQVYLPVGEKAIVQYTYVNGWPVTFLSAATLAGAQSAAVDDVTGVTEGMELTVYDGASTEIAYVQSVNGNQISFASPLIFAHATQTEVSALPAEVRQACIYIASYFVKQRRSGGALMAGRSGVKIEQQGHQESEELEDAATILEPYRRVI